jgi:hypothetical protein
VIIIPGESFQSRLDGVTQPASMAKSFRLLPWRVSPIARLSCPPPVQSLAWGVGHEPQSASEMRRADARSRQYGRPDGVTKSFQVIRHKIEPVMANRRLNLFSKNRCRPPRADEPEPDGPEMTRIGEAGASSGSRKTLAGTRSCPCRALVRPARQPEREGPAADSGEEMALGKSGKIICFDIGNAPLVNLARRQMPRRNQIAQPLRWIGIAFVVINSHCSMMRVHRNAV